MPLSYPDFFFIIIIIAFRVKTRNYPTLLKETNPLDGIGNILGNSNAPFIPIFFFYYYYNSFPCQDKELSYFAKGDQSPRWHR